MNVFYLVVFALLAISTYGMETNAIVQQPSRRLFMEWLFSPLEDELNRRAMEKLVEAEKLKIRDQDALNKHIKLLKIMDNNPKLKKKDGRYKELLAKIEKGEISNPSEITHGRQKGMQFMPHEGLSKENIRRANLYMKGEDAVTFAKKEALKRVNAEKVQEAINAKALKNAHKLKKELVARETSEKALNALQDAKRANSDAISARIEAMKFAGFDDVQFLGKIPDLDKNGAFRINRQVIGQKLTDPDAGSLQFIQKRLDAEALARSSAQKASDAVHKAQMVNSEAVFARREALLLGKPGELQPIGTVPDIRKEGAFLYNHKDIARKSLAEDTAQQAEHVAKLAQEEAEKLRTATKDTAKQAEDAAKLAQTNAKKLRKAADATPDGVSLQFLFADEAVSGATQLGNDAAGAANDVAGAANDAARAGLAAGDNLAGAAEHLGRGAAAAGDDGVKAIVSGVKHMSLGTKGAIAGAITAGAAGLLSYAYIRKNKQTRKNDQDFKVVDFTRRLRRAI